MVDLRSAWRKERAGILELFEQDKPGHRPWAWWFFDAPSPRLKIGGQGVPVWEKYPAVKPCYFMGIPEYFEDNDESDPLLYESESAYLKRHGLLSSEEEKMLTSADFEPIFIKR